MKHATRFLSCLLVLLLAATVNFLLPRVLPGDPVEFLVGEEASRLMPEQRNAVLAEFRLERSLAEQYLLYLASVISLDFGTSVGHGVSVLTVVAQRLPWTLLLSASAIVLATILGFALACAFHCLPGRRLPSVLMGILVMLGSLPTFWVGMVMIAVFGAALGWFPSHGTMNPVAEGWIAIVSVLHHAALPVTTLTLFHLPAVFLLARAGLESALGSGYVALARSHGAGPTRVLVRQAAPNAVLPLANQFAISFGGILGGTVVVESVFAYPGLGLLLYEGILAHDFPLVQGIFLLFIFAVVAANIAADLLQVLLDQRLRPARRHNP